MLPGVQKQKPAIAAQPMLEIFLLYYPDPENRGALSIAVDRIRVQ